MCHLDSTCNFIHLLPNLCWGGGGHQAATSILLENGGIFAPTFRAGSGLLVRFVVPPALLSGDPAPNCVA